jgi:hypothetical protein
VLPSLISGLIPSRKTAALQTIYGAGVFPITPITTLDDLTRANMYGYFLPLEEVTSRKWTVEIVPFQLNCSVQRRHPLERVFSPLYIHYFTENGELILNIRISDGDPFVPPVTPEAITQLNSAIIKNGVVEYYLRSDESSQIYFQDSFGLDVVVESAALSADEITRLISTFEYAGAEPEQVVIPWRDRCK